MSRFISEGSGVAEEVLQENELELQELHGVGCSNFFLELGYLASSKQL